MVVIHVKRSDTEQFLFETTCATGNDELIRALVKVWNARIRIASIANAIDELAKYGPAKPEDLRGLSDDTPLLEGQGAGAAAGSSGSSSTVKDPSGQRIGEPPEGKAMDTLIQVARDARDYIAARQVTAKKALTVDGCQERLDNMRGAVTIAYPMGLPEYDPIRIMMEDEGALKGQPAGQDMLSEDTATLWWAGKEFHRDQTVGDRVGRNEKTKIVGKLQKPGAGAPVREPGISEEERKAMMAHFFKKQEEMKKLSEDDEDAHLSAAWANPRQLKESLHGTGGVSWRPR